MQSVAGVLKGKTVPNKSTVPKYAEFLSLSLTEFQVMAKPAVKAEAKGKPGKR